MTSSILWLSCIAAPLSPADAWSVGPDGASCVQLEDALAQSLAGWEVDAKNSVADEGVWARVNPDNPRQMVVLFSNEKVCREFLHAMREETGVVERPKPLDAATVDRELETWRGSAPGIKADWEKLTKAQRQTLAKDARNLFVGNLERERVSLAIESWHKRQLKAIEAGKPVELELRVRLGLYLRLFRIAFGDDFRPTTSAQ